MAQSTDFCWFAYFWNVLVPCAFIDENLGVQHVLFVKVNFQVKTSSEFKYSLYTIPCPCIMQCTEVHMHALSQALIMCI